jgi:drug/metabolite transporter (DMT)-like permease
MQQLRFNDTASKEFKIISLGGSFLILLIIGLVMERDNVFGFLKSGLPTGVFCGLINGVKNLSILIIYLYLPISIVSPTSTGLGIVVSFLAALLLYKEKYSKKQKVGVAIGAAAVVLFAIK